MQRNACRQAAFTLVELLVVVSIIALLIAILLPSLKKARGQAKDTMCRTNLHQLGVSIQYYVSDNQDRIPWIKGTRTGGNTTPTNFPFRQYHQILHLHRYLNDLTIYLCPRVNEGPVAGRPGIPLRGPRTVKGYQEGVQISYYTALASDRLFRERRGELFPAILPSGEVVDEVYTEYWFNDWNEGAGSGTIPAISGNIITNIPHPNYAVVMMDAIDWNPRHSGAENFLFLDAHVDAIPEDKYFDVDGSDDYGQARDKDGFGTRPFWCWGLGSNIIGD